MASSVSFLIASQRTHSTNPQGSTFNEHHAAFFITLHCCECCLTTLTRPSKSKLKFVGEVSFQLVSRFLMETPNDRAGKFHKISIIVTQLLLFGCFCRKSRIPRFCFHGFSHCLVWADTTSGAKILMKFKGSNSGGLTAIGGRLGAPKMLGKHRDSGTIFWTTEIHFKWKLDWKHFLHLRKNHSYHS